MTGLCSEELKAEAVFLAKVGAEAVPHFFVQLEMATGAGRGTRWADVQDHPLCEELVVPLLFSRHNAELVHKSAQPLLPLLLVCL